MAYKRIKQPVTKKIDDVISSFVKFVKSNWRFGVGKKGFALPFKARNELTKTFVM